MPRVVACAGRDGRQVCDMDEPEQRPGGWTRAWLMLGLVFASVVLVAVVILSATVDGLAGAPPSGNEIWPLLTLAASVVILLVTRRRLAGVWAGLGTVLGLAALSAAGMVLLGQPPIVAASSGLVPVALAALFSLVAGLSGAFTDFDRGASWPALATLVAALPVVWVNTLSFGVVRAEPLAVALAVALLLCVWPFLLCAWRLPVRDSRTP